MSWSVGVDVVSIERIEELAARHPERFIRRLYTPDEAAYCLGKKNSSLHFAARFAAKEAFVKAIGTGFRYGIAFKDIETVHDSKGKPLLVLHGKARDEAHRLGFNRFEVSLSHDRLIAVAVVLAHS